MRAAEVLAAEWATVAERGLEVAKARQVKIKAMLRMTLVDTEAALQGTLETLEVERSTLASEQKAQSEAD